LINRLSSKRWEKFLEEYEKILNKVLLLFKKDIEKK